MAIADDVQPSAFQVRAGLHTGSASCARTTSPGCGAHRRSRRLDRRARRRCSVQHGQGPRRRLGDRVRRPRRDRAQGRPRRVAAVRRRGRRVSERAERQLGLHVRAEGSASAAPCASAIACWCRAPRPSGSTGSCDPDPEAQRRAASRSSSRRCAKRARAEHVVRTRMYLVDAADQDAVGRAPPRRVRGRPPGRDDDRGRRPARPPLEVEIEAEAECLVRRRRAAGRRAARATPPRISSRPAMPLR